MDKDELSVMWDSRLTELQADAYQSSVSPSMTRGLSELFNGKSGTISGIPVENSFLIFFYMACSESAALSLLLPAHSDVQPCLCRCLSVCVHVCLSVCSLYLYRQGLAPQIHDLYGKVKFTGEYDVF